LYSSSARTLGSVRRRDKRDKTGARWTAGSRKGGYGRGTGGSSGAVAATAAMAAVVAAGLHWGKESRKHVTTSGRLMARSLCC
jgi:hypothetical protein